ncbi:MAG: hypothetical protein IKQ94_05450 [Bacteroidales bacterium]|nr:hypothetical protein [Bacteroidales bacterium]
MKKTYFSKALLLVAVALIGVALTTSCKKENSTNVRESNNVLNSNNIDTIHDVSFTECIHHSSKGFYNQDTVIVNCSNGIINIQHYNLEVNCAFDTVVVTSSIIGDTIKIVEKGIPEDGANCQCDINTSFQIKNVKTGTYYLSVWNGLMNREVFNCQIINR